jgi:hypothetical protein
MPTNRNAWQRQHRLQTGNANTKKYEKTPKGFLMRAYRNLQSRCEGLIKPHIYMGLPRMSREDFYLWAWHDTMFWNLYRAWVQAGYPRKMSPSVNRIDPARGYTRDNVEWLTHSVNSALANASPRRSDIHRSIRRALGQANA